VKFSNLNFDSLLAQYLYHNKKLNLPGIGTFETDSTVYVAEDSEKQKTSVRGITFRNANITKADDDLIDFIKEQTGKMKPLAISDLESYLTLGKQFLYIGKPFYLEGIGTLQLTKDGRFEFLPGEYISTKLEDPNIERSEGKKRSVHEENRIQQESNSNTIKIILLVLGIIATVVVIGWGGYYFYNKNAISESSSLVNDSALLQDSSSSLFPADSFSSAGGTVQHPASQSNTSRAELGAPGTYKFVVESTSNKTKALNRFRDLRSFGNKIQMETKDSTMFRLYYSIPATPADTLRIRDSLNRWYYGNARKIRVKVEQ
jgi:hypothetical protein